MDRHTFNKRKCGLTQIHFFVKIVDLIHHFRYNRDSVKVLGTVGEPINPEAWLWYYNVVGNKNCAIVDTFWQTETVSLHTAMVYITETSPYKSDPPDSPSSRKN